MEANLVEIFSSIQGEGMYVGYRQLFVRFLGCNIMCKYCDTIIPKEPHKYCLCETAAGNRDFLQLENPVSVKTAAEKINALLKVKHQAISFTGGEPLCHADFICALMPKLVCKAFLETNGTLVDEMKKTLPYVDIISMDIKLPSITGEDLWQKHRDFINVAKEKKLYIKLVISDETTDEEFLKAIHLVAEIDNEIPFIIQPVTPMNGCIAATPEKILHYQEVALQILQDVRVIPQTHKMINQM
ncbi:MAG: 7-carboxy-7-deazaguanine synthase QueE [Selenomonadaceae bacterium]